VFCTYRKVLFRNCWLKDFRAGTGKLTSLLHRFPVYYYYYYYYYYLPQFYGII